jgi:bacillithiol biosynthesis cysteine-adding enzyme BshC
MLQESYSFEDLQLSSQLVRDLISEHANVKPLVHQFYDIDRVQEQIKTKTFSAENRQVLVGALKRQNEGISLSDKSNQNIAALLDDKTFTITAGHQLNLLSGPLYSIYKISQSVAIAREMGEKYPDYHFVPVFWLATEDHDFEEINHIHLFGNKMSWEKEGQIDKITGRITLAGMDDFLEQIESKFQDPAALEVVKQFTNVYRDAANLGEATRKLINDLMGNSGLVIIDGDDPDLKQLFKATMAKEVSEQVGYKKVMETNELLEQQNYHQQVFVRESNLFYIAEDGTRQRISWEDDHFEVNDQPKTADELVAEINSHPERFSPNALYRPIYQEEILPNLVFIGGGGEMAYWLQLKSLFDAHEVPFPMLRTRDSILLYNKNQAETMNALKLELMDIKLGVDQIVKDIALTESEANLQLTDAEATLFKAKSQVMEKVHQVNANMETMVEAEFAKMIKSIERIESKLIKAEKSKHEQTQKKLIKIRDKFFPDNGFQERYENFLPYYLKDDEFVLKILSTLNAEKEPRVRLLEI